MRSIPVAVPLALALLVSPSAAAQSLGGLLGKATRAARAAADVSRVVGSKEGEAEDVTITPASQPDAPADKPGKAPLNYPATGVEPYPLNINEQVYSPRDYKFSAAMEAEKKAFDLFGRVSCNDCEGGYDYEDWPQRHLPNKGVFNPFPKFVEGLALNQSWSWKSRAATGRLTVTSEEPVGPFKCKQVRWELTRGAKTVSRPSLFCKVRTEFAEIF
ncbi:hypothetical protein ACCC88_08325 [Sphingomonas sp. Sphisp140]|uniref:hypothetical protein n=1 Tax=unclassified Sphingomonas TaxID=196159 RepID=UPI0039B11AA7